MGTVALVPLGLCGLSEMYFFYFGFMLSLARCVLGGLLQCLGPRSIRSRGNPRIVLNPSENRNSRGLRAAGGAGAWPTGSAQSGCQPVGQRQQA